MLACPIEGCGRPFRSDKALNAHVKQRHSTPAALTLIAEDIQNIEEDRRSAKRRRILPPEPTPVEPEPEEPRDIDLEVCPERVYPRWWRSKDYDLIRRVRDIENLPLCLWTYQ